MADAPTRLSVVVVDCRPGEQRVCELALAPPITVIEAIRAAKLGGDLDPTEVAVFNRRCRLDDPVRDGDRIEILRPLLVNPKEARRARALLGRRAR